MNDLYVDDCILILSEIIHEQGDVVFSLAWDSVFYKGSDHSKYMII
jgi:hypothetical protein